MSLISPDYSGSFSKLYFTLKNSSADDFALTARSEAYLLFDETPLPADDNSISVETSLNASGRIDRNLNWVELVLKSRNLDSDLISAERLSINFRYTAPGIYQLTKIGDKTPADINLKLDTETHSVRLELDADDFIFSEYFSPGRHTRQYTDFLGLSVTGNAALDYDYAERKLEYHGALAVDTYPDFIIPDSHIEASFAGNNIELTIADSRFENDALSGGFSGRIGFTGDLPEINGNAELDSLKLNNAEISTDISIATDNIGKYTVNSDSLIAGDLKLRKLKLSILPYQDNFDFLLEAEPESDDGQNESLYIEGVYQSGKDQYLQTVVSTENLSIRPLMTLIPPGISLPVDLLDFRLSSELFFSGDLRQMAFAASEFLLTSRTGPENRIELQLSGNNRRISLTNLNIIWNQNIISGQVSAEIDTDKTIMLSTSLSLNDLNYDIGGVYSVSSGALSLTGSHGFQLSLLELPLTGYTFQLKTEELPFYIGKDSPSGISADISGYFDTSENWKIFVNKTSVSALPISGYTGRLLLSAIVGNDGGQLSSLKYSDSYSELNGSGFVRITDFTDGLSGSVYLQLADRRSDENYSLLFDMAKGEAGGSLDINNFKLERLSGILPVEGDISGTAVISGSLASPELSLELTTGDAEFTGRPLDLNTSLQYKDLVFEAGRIDLNAGSISFKQGRGLLDFATGRHQLTGELTAELAPLTLGTQISITGKSVPIENIGDIASVMNQDMNLQLNLEDLLYNKLPRDDLNFTINHSEGTSILSGGPENSVSGRYNDDGTFTINIADPVPLTFAAKGSMNGGYIDARISGIEYVFDKLEIPFFYFEKGSITGDLKILGPFNDPDFYGQLDLNNLDFRPPIVQEKTKDLSTSFFFSGKSITLPSTRIITENGIVMMTIDGVMERWLPRNYDFNMSVPEGRGISAMFYRAPFYVSGFAEGNLRIYGDFLRMNVSGDIKAIDATIMFSNSLGDGKMGMPTEQIGADLKIRVGENNQLMWPSQTLPIVRAYIKPEDEFSLRYDSIPNELILDGALALKGGEIFYFERNFYIKEGSIRFTNDMVYAMDPLLSARAEIRDVNAAGELVKIFLIVDKSPLSSFVPRFESDPAMSTNEIISLLGGNILDTIGASDGDLGETAAFVTDLATQYALKGIENELKKTLGLDLLSIRTSFIGNIIEDKLQTSIVNPDDNFAKYLDNTTLFLGKYFTDDIFLQGLFQFDLYNDTGYSDGLNLNLDSEIKLEWEGPVANIEFSLFPDFVDPAAGLKKTSVGLSWHFSY